MATTSTSIKKPTINYPKFFSEQGNVIAENVLMFLLNQYKLTLSKCYNAIDFCDAIEMLLVRYFNFTTPQVDEIVYCAWDYYFTNKF